MKLSKVHVILHQVGINTKVYKTYVKALQKELDDNWYFNHVALCKYNEEYHYYLRKAKSECEFDFSGEYKDAIREGHMTPQEAYNWVFEEFINK